MKSNYRSVTKLFFRLNFLVYLLLAVAYAIQGLHLLFGYIFLSILISFTCFLFRKKIPESVLLVFYFVNADILVLLFSLTSKCGAGSELYPLIFAGTCFLFSYEYNRSTILCTIYALFSVFVYLYVEINFSWHSTELIHTPNDFYFYHHIFSFCAVSTGLILTSIAYGRELKIKTQTQKEQELRLIHEANHDVLTDLINRRRMWEHLKMAEQDFKDFGVSFHIFIFDIDNFKRTNDTFGHSCGDYVLSELAKIIKQSMPKNSKIGRWGGEEFLLLYRGFDDEEALSDVERIRSLVETYPFKYNNDYIPITITIGGSSSKHKPIAEQVIIDADKQLMKGKISGKNRVVAPSLKPELASDFSIFDTFMGDQISK